MCRQGNYHCKHLVNWLVSQVASPRGTGRHISVSQQRVDTRLIDSLIIFPL